jgi:SAM-dependent methyltransferase/uncharacterized protein YbaR (Trm112 family)
MENSLQSLLPLLACPHDRTGLQLTEAWVCCEQGHRFPVVENVPVLLREDVLQTIGIAPTSLHLACLHAEGRNDDPFFVGSLGLSEDERRQLQMEIAKKRREIDPVVSYLVGATNGNLYQHLIGSLPDYPIPTLPMPSAPGNRLLDLGCSWGRWSIAAARKGYDPVGLDPSLGAVLAAQRLSVRLGVPFVGVVGDARYLPFKAEVFDAVYSYSVLQHFSKQDTRNALHEIRRTLRDRGRFGIQMASAWGVRSFQLQARRRFRQPSSFEVRYWSPLELTRTFREIFGLVRMSVDCYFGLGLQAADIRFMSPTRRYLIYVSELLKGVAGWFRPLVYAADSLLLEGQIDARPGTRP